MLDPAGWSNSLRISSALLAGPCREEEVPPIDPIDPAERSIGCCGNNPEEEPPAASVTAKDDDGSGGSPVGAALPIPPPPTPCMPANIS